MVRGPLDLHVQFTVCLDWILIDHQEVEGAIVCVQDSIRSLLSTSIGYFSNSGISILCTAASSATSICQSAQFFLWDSLLVHADSVIMDLRAGLEKLLLRQNLSKDTHERWFSVDSMSFFIVDEGAPRNFVRITSVV